MEAKQVLIQRLRERQGNRTQNEFADFLGISRAMLSLLYSEERKVGVDTLTRIGEKYPDLAYLFLSESVREVNMPGEDRPQELATESPEAHRDAR